MQVVSRFRGIVAVALFLLTIVSTATAQYAGGTGEPNDPYQIATAADLILLGETPEDYDKRFILVADIDLDPNLPGRKVFDRAVIAPDTDPRYDFQETGFTGVFDGSGHTISHLTIRGSGHLGLFGRLGRYTPRAGEVRDLGVVDVNITGSGVYVGGLVGTNGGTVTQCHSTGAVTGTDEVGGLIGYNWGTVSQCYCTATISGGLVVGGLAGHSEGAVTRCHSTGAVTGTDIVGALVGDNWGAVTQCYSTAEVKGDEYVGGLVGQNSEHSIVS
jgi:hypothetical protein